jgi:hypothetical protein
MEIPLRARAGAAGAAGARAVILCAAGGMVARGSSEEAGNARDEAEREKRLTPGTRADCCCAWTEI